MREILLKYINNNLSSEGRGIRWKTTNIYERIKYGYNLEDTWDLDTHIAKIISEGGKQIIDNGDRQEEIDRMCVLFEKYSNNNRDIDDQEYKEMFNLLKKNFRGLWF